MIQATSGQPAEPQPVYRWLLWFVVVALGFVQAFVSFRGLDSAAGMEQAQAARELARWNYTGTKMISPMALRHFTGGESAISVAEARDAAQPPLPILVLAPVMKLTESWWTFDSARRVYVMDRVVACLGVFWLVMSLVLVHGAARRMFDTVLANFTVLVLALCLPLWEMSVGGSSRVLLLFLGSIYLHRLVEAARRGHEDEFMGLPLVLGMSLVAMLMTVTHWLAPWLVAALGIGAWLFIPTGRSIGVGTLTGLVLGLALLLLRNHHLLGEPLGVYKALLLGIMTPEAAAQHLRDLAGTTPAFYFTQLIQRLNGNLKDVFGNLYALFMGSIPALIAFISLLHRFRNPVVNSVRNITFTGWLGVLLASMLAGGQRDDVGDMQLHVVLVPVLTVFGLAVLAVLWARLQADRRTAWREHGILILAVMISGWPMGSGLYQGITAGLFFKDRLAQWPPYMPNRVALLTGMVEPQEVIVSDQPWAVAWYADRTAIWLPKDRAQLEAIQAMGKQEGKTVAGLLISPISSMDDRLHTQMSGSYGEWADVIFRGPVLGLGLDLGEVLKDRLPFRAAFPLTFTPRPDGRLAPALVFYSDRVRWEQLK